jgi:hypothetical protein
MSVYVGNFASHLDWGSIIDHLEDTSSGDLFNGDITRVMMERAASESEEQVAHEYNTIKKFSEVNFHTDSINWTNYRPGKHYPISVGEIFSNSLGGIYVTCMISKVPPGGVCGFHYDTNYHPEKNIKRYVCFISPPVDGQVFILEKEIFSNVPLGDCFCWDNLSQYHGAANIGFEPQYLYTIECDHP